MLEVEKECMIPEKTYEHPHSLYLKHKYPNKIINSSMYHEFTEITPEEQLVFKE